MTMADLHHRYQTAGYAATIDTPVEPADELFYLALRNISQKWTMPIRDWKAALNRFTIQFDERMPSV